MTNPIYAALATTLGMLAHADVCRDPAVDFPLDCPSIPVVHVVDGAPNFREPAVPLDKPLKTGRLFRSGALNELSDSDIDVLEGLGIRTIVDLRAAEEIDEDPNRHVGTVAHRIHLPIGTDPADVERLMDPQIAKRIRPIRF